MCIPCGLREGGRSNKANDRESDDNSTSTTDDGNSTFVDGIFFGGESKIVNGNPIWANAAPWQAALSFHNRFVFCGGVLINPNWVLTTAGCTWGYVLFRPLVQFDRAPST